MDNLEQLSRSIEGFGEGAGAASFHQLILPWNGVTLFHVNKVCLSFNEHI